MFLGIKTSWKNIVDNINTHTVNKKKRRIINKSFNICNFMNIADLQEISPNTWKAKYRGNYGTYTIKIKTDGKKTVDFSCSCPSDYYPCKHIPIVENAIREHVAKCKKNDNGQGITIELLLKELSHKELYDFIIKQSHYNPQLKNAILLDFTHKINKKETVYTQLIRDALNGLNFDFEDIRYDYDSIEIEILDNWFDKAENYIKENNPHEAILICKACIEEFAEWYKESDCDVLDYIDPFYQEQPFNLLSQALIIQGTDYNAIFDYCKSEMQKAKYKGTDMYHGFSKLFMDLSTQLRSDDFITFQDKLLEEITDKSSYEAKKILEQKIKFYRNRQQPDKADNIIRENIQIESFREELTKKFIIENKLEEAKKLINDFISAKGTESRHLHPWYSYKLQIAQKEKNIKEIQHISYMFIESGFDSKYYKIYKSTFNQDEWTEKMEKLIKHYEKNNSHNWFNSSIADVLQVEKQEERLMKYIEKHLNVDELEKYHTVFSSSFPEKTLALFKQVIDKLAQNTGREYYERIVSLFRKMAKIKGGNELVKDMTQQYKVLYKNRKAMMEIINKFLTK